MKKFSKKGVLLFVAAMAVCAFAMPSMASASSWGPIGTEHTLHTSNLGFFGDSTPSSSMCTNASFTVDVVSAAVIEITTASFSGCKFAAPSLGANLCTATPRGTSFPWTATAVTTSNIQIHGVDIDIPLEADPSGAACALAGASLRVTGTLAGARWLSESGTRTIELTGATGLVNHAPGLGTAPITPTGTITDAQGTLTVTG